MSKLIKGILGVALTVIGVVVPGAQFLVGIGLSLVGSALRPTARGGPRDASAATLQIGEYPRTAVFGRAAVAGSLVDAFNYGGTYGTDWELTIVALADHRCDALEGFYVNDTYVAFAGDGDVAGYNGQLKVWWRSGTETQALPSVVTTNGPGWTADDNGAGVCYVVVAYKADAADSKTPIWTSGRPRFLWVLRGAQCYDPRLDGTVAGGVGAHRRDNPATWTWSENPIVCRYNWARGIYACDRVGQPAQVLVGRGLSAIEAPPANLAWRANICDEMVAGAKRYRIGGVISAADTFVTVEEAFASACAGTIIQPEGAVEIDPGAARAVVASFTDADLLVGSKVRWQSFLGQADADWINTVVPGYIEPAQKWGQHAAPVLRDTADLTTDGGPRELSLSLAMVTNAAQAGRVGEILRRMGRLFGRGQVTLPPRFSGIEEGDWISWQSARYFGGATKVLRVDAWGSDQGWRHQLTLREIAATVFTDVAALADGAVTTSQAARAAIAAPGAGAWALSAGYLTAGGIKSPALVITGASDNPAAARIRFEYVLGAGVPTGATVWSDAGLAGPDTLRIEIPAAPGGTYYAAVSYMVDGVQGPRLVLGPVAAGQATYPDGTALQTVQPAEPGATAGTGITLYDRHGGTYLITGNTVTKVPGAAAAWDYSVYSRECCVGSAMVSGQLADDTFMGLSTDVADNSYGTGNKASWHRSAAGYWQAYVGGTAVWSGTNFAGLAFGLSTVFSVTYDGFKYRYFADNVLVYTYSGALSGGQTHVAHCSANYPGSAIKALRLSSNSDLRTYRDDGTTVMPQAEFRTSEGVAAAITGQAATATNSDFSAVTGATKPANNATVGAPTGTPVGTITAADVSATINSGGGVASENVSYNSVQTGQLNTIVSATQSGSQSVAVSLNSPNTNGPNGDGTATVVAAPVITSNNAGDAIFIDASIVVTAPTARGRVELQRSTDNATWTNFPLTTRTNLAPISGTGVGAATYSVSALEHVGHATGTLYYRIVMFQNGAQSLGDGTAGTTLFTITSGSIKVRKYFSK